MNLSGMFDFGSIAKLLLVACGHHTQVVHVIHQPVVQYHFEDYICSFFEKGSKRFAANILVGWQTTFAYFEENQLWSSTFK